MRITRVDTNPIITADLCRDWVEHGRANLNGPSLIRVPEWVDRPLGRYYLYFAHHQGTFIRLAVADRVEGPWRAPHPATLGLGQTPFADHIASPEVIVDDRRRRIVMYYHGHDPRPTDRWPDWGGQITCAAESEDGLSFTSRPRPLCGAYLRVFRWRDRRFGIVMPGALYAIRGDDGLDGFHPIADLRDDFCHPDRFGGENRKARHFALRVVGDRLDVFLSRTGDNPECILRSTVNLAEEPARWRATPPTPLLLPERDWEGGSLPPEVSRGGAIHRPARQLRDPAYFRDPDSGRQYLLYSVAGESGIAVAELSDD